MRRIQAGLVMLVVLAALMAFGGIAFAGPFGAIKNWMASEAFAWAISAVILTLSLVAGVAFQRVSKTLIEAGEFMTALGSALADSRISKDELTAIIKEAKDVFGLWRKTPEKYQVK